MWPIDREKEQQENTYFTTAKRLSHWVLSLFHKLCLTTSIFYMLVSGAFKKKKYVCSILYPSLPWNAMDYCKETCKLLADKSPRAQKPITYFLRYSFYVSPSIFPFDCYSYTCMTSMFSIAAIALFFLCLIFHVR